MESREQSVWMILRRLMEINKKERKKESTIGREPETPCGRVVIIFKQMPSYLFHGRMPFCVLISTLFFQLGKNEIHQRSYDSFSLSLRILAFPTGEKTSDRHYNTRQFGQANPIENDRVRNATNRTKPTDINGRLSKLH